MISKSIFKTKIARVNDYCCENFTNFSSIRNGENDVALDEVQFRAKGYPSKLTCVVCVSRARTTAPALSTGLDHKRTSTSTPLLIIRKRRSNVLTYSCVFVSSLY